MARLHLRPGFCSTVAILALAAFVMPARVQAAVSPMFTPVATGKVARQQFDVKSAASPIVINRAALARLAVQDELEFVLPNATRYTVVFDRIEDHGGGIQSSVGYLKARGKDFRVIITSGPSGTFGAITTPETIYRIIPGDGHDWMVDYFEEKKYLPPIDLSDDTREPPPELRDGGKLSPHAAALMSRKDGAGQATALQATPTPQATIDLMVVYTTGLGTRLGPNLMTRLYNLVTSANTAYADSEIAMTLRLVNATMVNYPDPPTNVNDDDVALDDITPTGGGGVGVFANIETIRNAFGADLVAFLRSGSDFGGHGIAWVATSSTTSSASLMYSVTTGCVVGCDSVLIHEMGHNMGNKHDRATAAYQAGGIADSSLSGGAFPYSFGHFFCNSGSLTCNPNLPAASGGCTTQPACSASSTNNIGTIMSYFNPVTLKFSNPNLLCAPAGGGGISQPCGVVGSSNNALSMNNVRTIVAGVKTTTIATLPGAIQLSASSYSAAESGGSISITVNRVGGSAGSVSVNYATVDGTAKAGYDYTATSGTLTWANGDSAAKTIIVPIVNDGITEGGELFSISLSNPAGATGVFLGNPTNASVILSEGWPPGGTFPVGYVTPGTSSGAWSTATDRLFEGTVSLRSAQTIGPGAGAYNNSDLEYTSTFPSGNVTFAYNVSSYSSSQGVLEFWIDSAVVFTSAGGETGWLTTSQPISAGAHTLRWRFKNRLTFPCSNVNPPAPGGSNCADRAWIDSVILPTTLAASTTSLSSSANPATSGQSITLTATVSGAAGTPAGVVTFRDGGAIISGCDLRPVSGGTAQCTTSALAIGSHNITAAYSGNSIYDVSTSSVLTQNVTGFVLTVTRTGTGVGNVTSSPAGINTSTGSSSASFLGGTTVTLSQTPQPGSVFSGWSGACTGSGACSVLMNASSNVTATFNALCVAGTFSTTGLAPCTLASPGNFVAGTGATAQSACAVGFYQPNAGASSCLPASIGNFVPVTGSANQTACAAGSFQPNTGAASCNQASPGNFVAVAGSATQTPCSVGRYQPNAGAITCIDAGAGNFVASTGAIAQTACAAGFYQPATGAGSCITASPGSFVAVTGSANQTPCVAGTFQPNSGAVSCNQASPGNFVATAGATSQTACSAGRYQPNSGATACIDASAGSFVAGTGSTTQTSCAPGSYQPATGATACLLAQPGFFVSIAGAIQQTACPPGSTSTSPGATSCISILPGAPTGVAGAPGNANARISFAAPASDGGSPILDYTVACVGPNTLSVSGPASPIVVTGLTNGQLYNCSVTARNANGAGPGAGTGVTPSASAALALNRVVSRKMHGGLGPFDIGIDTGQPISGLVSVESRTIGAGHNIVFQFNNTVTSGGTATALDPLMTPVGSTSISFNGNEVAVSLAGVPDNKRVTVTLSGVGSANGTSGGAAAIGFLVGDVSNSRSVSAADISAAKAHATQTTSSDNARFDINASGSITSTDVSAVKARSGQVLQ